MPIEKKEGSVAKSQFAVCRSRKQGAEKLAVLRIKSTDWDGRFKWERGRSVLWTGDQRAGKGPQESSDGVSVGFKARKSTYEKNRNRENINWFDFKISIDLTLKRKLRMTLLDMWNLFIYALLVHFSQTFEIIHVPFKQNKSPIQLVHHHLGIESWCIKYVYQYAHRYVVGQREQNRMSPSIVKYLNFAILINPDVASFWNVRRQLVERVQLSITQEFQFSALVLSKKPKSSEAFFYRRWLYSFQSKLCRELLIHFIIDTAFFRRWGYRLGCRNKLVWALCGEEEQQLPCLESSSVGPSEGTESTQLWDY